MTGEDTNLLITAWLAASNPPKSRTSPDPRSHPRPILFSKRTAADRRVARALSHLELHRADAGYDREFGGPPEHFSRTRDPLVVSILPTPTRSPFVGRTPRLRQSNDRVTSQPR